MKMLLLTRIDSHGYDEFSDFVVVANTVKIAQKEILRKKDGDGFYITGELGEFPTWVGLDNIKVTEIGTTDKYDKPTVILGSFHAG